MPRASSSVVRIMAKVEQTNQRYRLFEPGQKVLIALSGGPDSVALFHIFCLLAPRYNLELGAAHVDHGLRPASAKERQFCRALCRFNRVRYHSVKVDVRAFAKRHKLNIEEAGRLVRHRYFDTLCRRFGYERIATAHNADDSAETVLLHLVRGADLGGLLGILPKRGNLIRPLIEVTKNEILGFLAEMRLTWCIDRSNFNIRYARNMIRNRVFPLLGRINPQAVLHTARAGRRLAEFFAFLEQLVSEFFERCKVKEVPWEITLDLSRLGGYHFLRSWVLMKAYSFLSGETRRPDAKLVAAALSLDRNGAWVKFDSKVIAVKTKNCLTLARRLPRMGKTRLSHGKTCTLAGGHVELSCAKLTKWRLAEIKANTDENVAYLDGQRATRLVVRNINREDRFKPLGMSHTKKAMDYLADRGVVAPLRQIQPVVEGPLGIAWIPGHGISEDYKVTRLSRYVVKLSLVRRG